jgi:hypothetical protein
MQTIVLQYYNNPCNIFLVFQETVLNYLEKLKSEIDVISGKLRSLCAANAFDEENRGLFTFPLLTEEDVSTFDSSLEDSVVKKSLVLGFTL